MLKIAKAQPHDIDRFNFYILIHTKFPTLGNKLKRTFYGGFLPAINSGQISQALTRDVAFIRLEMLF